VSLGTFHQPQPSYRHETRALARLLPMIAAGCLGGSGRAGTSTPIPTGRLAITVRMVSVRQVASPCPPSAGDPCGGVPSRHPPARRFSTRRYLLSCDPVGGTMPNPQAACAAMADLSKQSPLTHCTGDAAVPAPTAIAILVGTFGRHPVKLYITNESWCGQPRPVMRDLWVLSTFPCSTAVNHFHTQPYATFASDTGCKST
jgi:hypothetical protein